MSTTLPVSGEWTLCIRNPQEKHGFTEIGIIGWHVKDPHSVPIPYTPFGLADASTEYVIKRVVADKAVFMIIPNGPAFTDYNKAAAHFAYLNSQVQTPPPPPPAVRS